MHNILDDILDLVFGIIVLIFTATVLVQVGYQLIDMSNFGFNTIEEPSILSTVAEKPTAPITTAQVVTIPYVDSSRIDTIHNISGVEYATDKIVEHRANYMAELSSKFNSNSFYNISVKYDSTTKTRFMEFIGGVSSVSE